MEQSIINPVEMGRGISEYGFMSVASACFLLTSITIMFLFIRWFIQIHSDVVKTQTQSIKELLETQKELLQSSKESNRAHEEQAERQKEQGKALEEIRLIIMNYEL